MANTVIQIKRSTVTTAPTAGSLSAAEPAYSYLSDKLFIGSSDGNQVVEIGGRYYVDATIAAFDQANLANSIAIAAFEKANTGDSEVITAAFAKANAANLLAYNTGIGANAYATAVGTAGNAYATSVGTAGNNYTNTVGAAGNAYALSTATDIGIAGNNYTNAVGAAGNNYTAATYLPLAGGTITGSLVVQQNLTVSGTVTYANTQTLLIGDNIFILNADLPVNVSPSENAGMEINRGSSANVSLLWNEGIDKWQFTNDGTNYYNIASNADVTGSETIAIAAFSKANAANILAYNTGIGANAYATSVGTAGNNYTDAVGAAGNAYATAIGTAANTNAANASYLSTGTVPSAQISGSYTGITGVGTITAGVWNGTTITVPYGGTGVSTLANNGILFGNITGAVRVTAAGTEGNVLQVNNQGTPLFGMLDGGTF